MYVCVVEHEEISTILIHCYYGISLVSNLAYHVVHSSIPEFVCDV